MFENEHFCHNTNYRMMLDEKFTAGSEQLLGREGARGYRNPSFYIQPPLLEEKIFSGETEILLELVHDTTQKSESHQLVS